MVNAVVSIVVITVVSTAVTVTRPFCRSCMSLEPNHHREEVSTVVSTVVNTVVTVARPIKSRQVILHLIFHHFTVV